MANPALRYYACGETDQELSRLYRGHAPELRTFPAGVFLFEHQSGEKVLFDTGYSTSIYSSGFQAAVYRRLLPPRVSEPDNIHNQLLADGIEPSTIGHVVLSHLHPDHIGGVQYFPESQFVMSSGAAEVLRAPKLKDGFLRKLLPDWFGSAPKTVLNDRQLESKGNGLVEAYDLFDDESFLLTKLPGHARGQIGALVLNKLMLAADGSWGKDLLDASFNTKVLAGLANYDMKAYRQTVRKLQEIQSAGVELCFSHDTYDRKVLIA